MKVLHTITIERAGQGAYPAYRIPGIVATGQGTLVVYYEARHGGDWSVIDLYARRSVDGGQTWLPRQMLFSGQGVNTTNNPVIIVDGQRLHLLCLENYKRLFHRVSEDDGITWSRPREITSALNEARDVWPWTCAAVGPGHGLRLDSGRLLASVWLANAPEQITSHGNTRVSTIYSDDGGDTWHMGDVFCPQGAVSPNEACLAQLSDGKVFMNIRTARPVGEAYTAPHVRTLCVSSDGTSGWQTWPGEPLTDPVCAGGMCNVPGGVLFTNCMSCVSRSNHTLRLSRDDGRTWPERITYEPLAGYSDVAWHSGAQSAFVFYEYERESELRVSRISLA